MPIEYIIKQKNEGKTLVKKICAIIGYILLTIVLLVFIVALSPPALYLPFSMLALSFVALIIFITWRFLCVEFEIVIGSGEFTATLIWGKSIIKRLVCVPLQSLIEVGNYDDNGYERLSAMSIQENYICVSSMSAERVYYGVFDKGEDRCVIYFEADERGIEIIRRANRSAFRHS